MSERLYPKPDQVDQFSEGRFSISWNPDDNKYYLEIDGETVACYINWRNATARMRKEKNKL